MAHRSLAAIICSLALWPATGGADVAPLITAAARPLIGDIGAGGGSAGSLFAGTRPGAFFAPLGPRDAPRPRLPGGGDGPVDRLLTLIAEAEAGAAGYDAYNRGARIPPPAPPSQMTLGEIYAWIDATPGQPHAIGRYQFIPPTLRRVAGLRGYGPATRFSAQVQDSLAGVLLAQAGLREFTDGGLGRGRFMRNLARIWAGLPLPNGDSYYEGYAGNTATMTWRRFADGMDAIWPQG